MKNGFFKVIPPNLQAYEMSIREADLENDVFRVAFDEACKQDKPADAKEEIFAWDFFKYGWEAAVRLLNDDAAHPAAPVVDGDLPPLPDLEHIDLTYAIAGKLGEFYPQESPRDMEKNHRLARAIQRLPLLRTQVREAQSAAIAADRARRAGSTAGDAVPGLLAALKPFADAYAPEAARMARHYTPEDVAKFGARWDANTITPAITMGDFRRAYEAFSAAPSPQSPAGETCDLCEGERKVEGGMTCPRCDGSGKEPAGEAQ